MDAYADGALRLSIDAGVARLTLDRPRARNALNVAMWRAIPQALAAAADASVRVLVVTGAAGHFAAGADFTEFGDTFADHGAALAYGRDLERATLAVASFERPVIARIEGFCIGAGLALALACDRRIAASDARFSAPPAKLGLVYSLADTRRLVEATSASVAKFMLFTGAQLSAPEALRVGLIDAVCAPDAIEASVEAEASAIVSVSPWSVRHAKAMLAMIAAGATHDTPQTRDWFAAATQGPDFAEGLAALRARRPPNFAR